MESEKERAAFIHAILDLSDEEDTPTPCGGGGGESLEHGGGIEDDDNDRQECALDTKERVAVTRKEEEETNEEETKEEEKLEEEEGKGAAHIPATACFGEDATAERNKMTASEERVSGLLALPMAVAEGARPGATSKVQKDKHRDEMTVPNEEENEEPDAIARAALQPLTTEEEGRPGLEPLPNTTNVGDHATVVTNATNATAAAARRNNRVPNVPGAFHVNPFPFRDQPPGPLLSVTSNASQNLDSIASDVTIDRHRQQQDDDDGRLLRARPVSDDGSDRNNLPGAVPVDLEQARLRQKRLQQKKRVFCIFLVMAVVVVIVAMVLSAVVSSENGKENLRTTVAPSSSTAWPTLATTIAPAIPLFPMDEQLPNTAASALLNPLSPQSKAYEWLTRHPHLEEFPSWRRIQLFALATFFYAFDGDTAWPDIIRDDWLVYNKSECDWFSAAFASMRYNMITEKYIIFGLDNNVSTCDNDLRQRQVFTKLNLNLPGADYDFVPNSMPPEMALLTSLKQLRMYGIQVHGPMTNVLTPDFLQLPHMEEILLVSANVTGTLSPDVVYQLQEQWAPTLGRYSVIGTLTGQSPARSAF